MQTSKQGLIDIASHEGICLTRYKDSVGVWTWGIGHTSMSGEPDPVKITKPTSLEYVFEIFQKRISGYENAVRRNTKHLPLTQWQFDALVSFTYNVGEGNLKKLLTNRNIAQIGQAILLYNKAGGKTLNGLVKRRRLEQAMFLQGSYSCKDGKVNVFPVNSKHQPVYSAGKLVDVRPYITAPEAVGASPGAPGVPDKGVAAGSKTPVERIVHAILDWLASLFKKDK